MLRPTDPLACREALCPVLPPPHPGFPGRAALHPRVVLCLLVLSTGAFAVSFPSSRLDEPANVRQWQEQVRRAVGKSRGAGPLLVMVKKARRLDYYRDGRLQRSMYVDLGADPVTRKLHSDFRTTPEGLYRVVRKLGLGETLYTLALLIDYPNDEDRRRYQSAQARGEVQLDTGIGGSIEIHGMGGLGQDWTWGCMAVSDEDMRWLFPKVEVGTPVLIVGNDGRPDPVR